MIAVFAGFAMSEERVLQMLGIGLASAVFLDAFIVRTMLVPSVMHRLDASNWWHPRWLDRITPRVSIEPPDEVALAEQHNPDDEGRSDTLHEDDPWLQDRLPKVGR